jgi:hypothetical protein
VRSGMPGYCAWTTWWSRRRSPSGCRGRGRPTRSPRNVRSTACTSWWCCGAAPTGLAGPGRLPPVAAQAHLRPRRLPDQVAAGRDGCGDETRPDPRAHSGRPGGRRRPRRKGGRPRAVDDDLLAVARARLGRGESVSRDRQASGRRPIHAAPALEPTTAILGRPASRATIHHRHAGRVRDRSTVRPRPELLLDAAIRPR